MQHPSDCECGHTCRQVISLLAMGALGDIKKCGNVRRRSTVRQCRVYLVQRYYGSRAPVPALLPDLQCGFVLVVKCNLDLSDNS